MLRRVALVPLLTLTVSCGIFGKKGGGSDGNGDAPPPTASTTKEVQGSETDGAVTGSFVAGSTDTQTMKASANSEIAGSSVTFPPGALAVDVDVTLEQGVSLMNDNLAATLGLGQGTLSEGGPAVAISSTPPINASQPFTIALQATQSTSLLATSYVVVFKSIDATTGKLTLGVTPIVSIDGKTIVITVTQFGVYQVFLTSVAIAEPITKETDDPIKTVRDEKNEGTLTDKIAPTLSSVLPPGPGIPAVSMTQTFTLKFSEPVAAATAVVSGSMLRTDGVNVTSPTKDSLLIAPKSSWVLEGTKLKVSVKDLAGNPSPEYVIETEVVGKIVYVHPSGKPKTAGGLGTLAAPYDNFRDAADLLFAAKASGFVYGAEGTYLDQIVPMYPGTRIVGGFDSTFGARSPKDHPTIISGETATDKVVVDCVEGDQASSFAYSLLSGVTVQRPAGRVSDMLVKIDGAPQVCTIQDSVLRANGSENSRAIVVTNASVRLIGNDISTSEAQYATAGVVIDNTNVSGKSVEIIRNKIIAGDVTDVGMETGFNSGALEIANPAGGVAKIHDNVLVAGSRPDGEPGASVGLEIHQGAAEIRNNTIVAGSATNSISFYSRSAAIAVGDSLGEGNTIQIDNNALVAGPGSHTLGIYAPILTFSLPSVTSIQNNAIRLFPMPMLAGVPPPQAATGFETVELLEAGASMGQVWSGNLPSTTSDLLFKNMATHDYRPQAGSPLIDAGLEGNTGPNPWDFGGSYLDLGGTPRGAHWSIGAYQ